VRTAARILVAQLLVLGVDTAYCVPGESYISVLDALGDSPIRLYTTRHEAAAANMAEAYGKLTGRPGVCLVTRAPGATHAAVGIHTAYQDSTPLVLLVGQVPRGHLGREAFQELDYTRMFGEMAKAVTTLEDAGETPELIARAFHTATSGRSGPVVVALPEDVQDDVIHELSCPRYEILDSRGKIKIEPKERIIERLGVSPDLAESLLLAFVPANWTAELQASGMLAMPSLLEGLRPSDLTGRRSW